MNISDRTAWLLAALAVVVLVIVSHGWSLDSGLFLDDHSHFSQMRESGWSYGDIVEAGRLGIIGRVMHLWFKDEVGLRFYRPVSFLLMKLQYTLVGWQPEGAHAFSLLWHTAAAMLVFALAGKCLGGRFWAALAACLFATHPGHVLTVYWVACQTELMVVTFILSAVLCYLRYSNWPTPMFTSWSRLSPGPGIPGGHFIWLAASCMFFALALGCRENAVVFPAIAVTGDILLRPTHIRRRIFAYAVFAIMFGLYLHLRSSALGGFPMPTRPYMVPPGDPDFASFVVEKAVYYTVGLFALLPVLPIGGLIYFREHPLTFYGTFALVLLVWGSFLVVFRRRRGVLLAPAWVLLSMAPVIAVFASGHHLYLPGVGAALMVTTFWAWLVGDRFGGSPIKRKWLRTAIGRVALVLHVILLPGFCWAFGWTYRASTDIEDLFIRDVVEVGPPLSSGDKLFFVNMSMMAYYAIPAIEQQTGTKGLRGYVLTFSPTLMMMEEPCKIEQIDEHSFSVTLERDGFFRGAMGKVLREAMKREKFFDQGERISSDEFDVIVDEASDEGIRKLVFRFRQPLGSPGYRIYLGSRYRPAYPLTWRCPTTSPSGSRP